MKLTAAMELPTTVVSSFVLAAVAPVQAQAAGLSVDVGIAVACGIGGVVSASIRLRARMLKGPLDFVFNAVVGAVCGYFLRLFPGLPADNGAVAALAGLLSAQVVTALVLDADFAKRIAGAIMDRFWPKKDGK